MQPTEGTRGWCQSNKNVAPRVSVLLATYNGERFVGDQIKSLAKNAVNFTLEWLDDSSTDNTRDVVKRAIADNGLQSREWPCSERQGYPRAFFTLLEVVEADIYLFCDQDDIWQPGRIDAVVAELATDLCSPVLGFSEALMFRGDEPQLLTPVFRHFGMTIDLSPSRALLFCPAQGNTIAFTRPLREIFVGHKNVAQTYAPGHDCWMYLIASTAGCARVLTTAATTLYRAHDENFSSPFIQGKWWLLQQIQRVLLARQARGFLLATPTLPPGNRLARLSSIAQIVQSIECRQSPWTLLKLTWLGAMPPSFMWAARLWAACLFTDARETRWERLPAGSRG